MMSIIGSPKVGVVFWCYNSYGELLLRRRSADVEEFCNAWEPGDVQVNAGEFLEAALVRGLRSTYGITLKQYARKCLMGYREFFSVKSHRILFDYLIDVDQDLIDVDKGPKNNDPDTCSKIEWFPVGKLPSIESLHRGLVEACNMYEALWALRWVDCDEVEIKYVGGDE